MSIFLSHTLEDRDTEVRARLSIHDGAQNQRSQPSDVGGLPLDRYERLAQPSTERTKASKIPPDEEFKTECYMMRPLLSCEHVSMHRPTATLK
jgi:hypothetical protein